MCNLLPCPFCGAPAETDETGTIAYCTGNCNQAMTMVGVPVAEWNKRAESAEFKKYKEETTIHQLKPKTGKTYLICKKCGYQNEIKPMTNTEQEIYQNTIVQYKKQLEQREDFIYDVFATLKNSNSKSTVVSVLLSRCEAQINSQMLGVI